MFDLLFPTRVILTDATDPLQGDWSMRESVVTQEDGETLLVDGTRIDSISDLSTHQDAATQSVEADKPTVDLLKVPGLRLAEATGTQHFVAEQDAAIVAILVEFWTPSSVSADKGLAARDTSATTTKAALDVAIV